jgi:hypothetical protein
VSSLDFLLFSSLSFHKRKTCSLHGRELEKIERKYKREKPTEKIIRKKKYIYIYIYIKEIREKKIKKT